MSADQITDARIAEIALLAKHLRDDGKIVGAILCELLDAITALRDELAQVKGTEERYLRVVALSDGARLDTLWQELVAERNEARAEVQRLTEQVERFKTGAVRVSLDGAVYFEPYVQLLRDEITKLREEARRSDAGRVEVPDPSQDDIMSIKARHLIGWLAGYKTAQERSRLSPSPQPAIQIAHIGDSMRDSLQPDGSVLTERWTKGEPVERVVSQPSADVVVPKRILAEMLTYVNNCTCEGGGIWTESEAVNLFDTLRSSTNHDSKET